MDIIHSSYRLCFLVFFCRLELNDQDIINDGLDAIAASTEY